MSPRSSTLLAFIGVLLAGIPLPALTAARDNAPVAEPTQPAAQALCQVYATLQCSGQPTELRLMHEGRVLVCLGADELAVLPWEGELSLPAAEVLELELIAHWPEPPQGKAQAGAQAVCLALEPEGKRAQQHTEWTLPGGNTLHSLFLFSW